MSDDRMPVSDELGEAEELRRFREIIDSSCDWAWEMDKSGRISWIYGNLPSKYDLRASDCLGKRLDEIIRPQEAKKILLQLRRAGLNGNDRISAEVEFTLPNGIQSRCTLHGRLIRSDKGNILGFRGLARDRFRAERVQQDLERIQGDFWALVDAAKTGIVVCDLKGLVLFDNPASRLLLESKHQSMSGRQISDFGVDLGLLMPKTQLLFLRDQARWVSCGVRKAVWRGQEAFVLRFVDVTSARKLELSVAESERKYRDLFENARDLMYVHDLNGYYLEVNKAWEQTLGYSREETLGAHYSRFVADSSVKKGRKMQQQKLSGIAEVTNYESVVRSKSGELIPLELSTRILREGGKPVAIQGTARDLRQRKRLEQEVINAQKVSALALLAGGIAHDFNNLLTVIIWTVRELLDTEAAMSLKGLDALRRVIDLAQRSSDLTRQLLTYCKERPNRRAQIQLNGLLVKSKELLERLIPESIDVQISVDASYDRIEGDPSQIEQVMTNLVINACDAIGEAKGLIRISTENEIAQLEDENVEVQWIVIRVEDSGCGMSKEIMSRIFDPFFSTKSNEGTGLGLAVVHGIIASHGGKITVSSEPGNGSAFEIRFRTVKDGLEETDPATSSRRAQFAPHECKGMILLVENDEWLRVLIRRTLVRNGFQVTEAGSICEAKAAFRNQWDKYSILIADVILSDGSGVELFRELRAQKTDLGAVFTTGHAALTVIQEIEGDLKLPLLRKPFEPEELLSALTGVGAAPPI